MLSLTSNGKYKTTTWSGRGDDQIAAMAELCQNSSPSLIAIGPWWILPIASTLSIYGKQTHNMILNSACRIMQVLESGLRKTGMFGLESFETEEILGLLSDTWITPSSTLVVDMESKVLQAVRKKIGERATYLQADLAKDIFHIKGDIIFCNNVLQRIRQFDAASKNLVNMCEVWWLIWANWWGLNDKVASTLQSLWCDIIDKQLWIYRRQG